MLFLPMSAVLFGGKKSSGAVFWGWLFVFLCFSSIIGLRFEVGGDWLAYLGYLDRASSIGFFSIFNYGDPGYYFVNWAASKIGMGIYFVNTFCASVLVAGVILFSRRQPIPWLAFLISVPYLLIVVGMGYSRQATALGFVLFAINAFQDRKTFSFVFWVVLAAAFHKSAVIMLPVFALAYGGNRLWNIAWMGAVSVIGAYLFVFDSVSSLWAGYVVSDYESEGALVRVVMNSIPAFVFLKYRSAFGLDDGVGRLWWWVSFLAIICIPLVLLSSTATDRVALYLIPLQLFVFSRLPLLLSSARNRASVLLAIVAYYVLVQFVWLFFAGHAYAWLPYQMYPFSS